MTKWLVAAVIGLLAAGALGAVKQPKAKQFVAIDRCLRSGGAWDLREHRCQDALPGPIDRILVDKSDHRMMVFRDGTLIREFRIALGRGGLAPKQRQGDRRVPEGEYEINFHNAASGYHRSLRIGYPTPSQVEAARLAGFSPGNDIMIHGLPNGMGAIGSRHVLRNWTDGCIAVTNQEMEWLFTAVPDGTVIEIRA